MKRWLLLILIGLLCANIQSSVTAQETRLVGPHSIDPGDPAHTQSGVCPIQLSYDDGTDDSPGSGTVVGWIAPDQYQFAGLRFTAPADGPSTVLSVSWFSDLWELPGIVDVTVTQVSEPSNTATATVAVFGAGTWEAEFETPICIPSGADFVAMICPRPGTLGVMGEDLSVPSIRSRWTISPFGCAPTFPTGKNYMIRSCVESCASTPTTNATWGRVKSLYR